ncbi:MAG TPA: AraC family transcriptional regulator [Acetobacteraceae bacterium]|nr:AraC family transcriptional regulator [Acetobacteraceae bacterium]
MAPKPLTQQMWGRRIARAMALIAEDPSRTRSLEELAGAAALSPCHFHRVYRAMTGETPAGTLSRERLARAAVILLREGVPVAAVARRCGYGSAAALTRAFRGAYGMPPAAYRAARGIGAAIPASPATHEREQHMFEVRIVEAPALRLAALPHRGPYTGIGATFGRLQAWAAARGLDLPGARWIGLYQDDPESVPAAQLRSEACVTVGPEAEAAEGVRILELPASRVATLVFRGPYPELERAYAWLYREWLPGSGEEPADAPCREEYLNDPKTTPPAELLTAVQLPLRARVLA